MFSFFFLKKKLFYWISYLKLKKKRLGTDIRLFTRIMGHIKSVFSDFSLI